MHLCNTTILNFNLSLNADGAACIILIRYECKKFIVLIQLLRYELILWTMADNVDGVNDDEEIVNSTHTNFTINIMLN